MSALSSERFSYNYNANKKIRADEDAENTESTATPRRSIKITSLLNDANESSPNVFPLFSSFQSPPAASSGFQSTTAAMNNAMVLHRPITPFENADSRSVTPLGQLSRPFTPTATPSSKQDSVYTLPHTPITPLTPVAETSTSPASANAILASPPPAPKRALNEPISFEAQTNVLDFRPLKTPCVSKASSGPTEGKLLDFSLNGSDISSRSGSSSPVSPNMNCFTSRFISNPNLFKNRKFQCKICDKRFKTTGHLTRHKKIHSGEKKFECSYPGCSSKFSRKDNCMQHYRTHTNGKTVLKNKKLITRLENDQSILENVDQISRPATPVKKLVLVLK